MTGSARAATRSAPGSGLPDIWLKAAILGSLWASIEIILGSFLHNIRMPLSGTFLAALGVILLINGYQLWPAKGLFWRAALITATMKSLAPSAIIFGPMVGIFMEGIILEFFVRLTRGRWPGFIIGAALAVSWSLFQKIFVLLLTYGPDFVKLYEQLYRMAAETLHYSGSAPFDLVKMVFIIDLGFGALVAGLTLASLNKIDTGAAVLSQTPSASQPEDFLRVAIAQHYSLLLLLLNSLVLVAGLAFLDRLSIVTSSLCVLLYIALNILRYAHSLKRLKNPQLWIQLFAIMGLSGMLLGGWQNQAAILQGLLAGLGMAIRALLVIFGFSALSIELRNPVIVDWFSRRGLHILFEALSVSFEVLPRLMKMVSAEQRTWQNPFQYIGQLLTVLEQLRQEHLAPRSRVLIITGEQGEGKTSLVQKILALPPLKPLNFAGLYCAGVWQKGERDHYLVVDIQSSKSALLCERSGPPSEIQSGRYNFREVGLTFGRNILQQTLQAQPDLVIVDEIGHLELNGSGWAAELKALVDQQQTMVWTIRPTLLDRVIAKWPVRYRLIQAGNATADAIDEATKWLIQ